jgi:hypothetical protein
VTVAGGLLLNFRSRQRGQAVLALLLLLGIALSVFIYNAVDPTQAAARREARTQATMREVRDALIGWSVGRTSTGALPNARPGELPCPDFDNDGFEDGSCAAGALGRVPWKTLGIPEPRDESGETLWYAIAGPFRIWNMNNTVINSDTKGNITVYRGTTATVATNEAVAVIFSAGAALGAQDRGCTVGVNCTVDLQCTTSPASLTPKCNPANYLETAATVNNATIGGPFISAQASNNFNDKLHVVTTSELITVVEQRVARELLALLTAYSTAPGKSCGNNCYTAADEDFTNEEDNSAFRGWLPLCEADPDNWGDLGISLPAWLTNNDWWKVIYYAVAPDKTENNSGGTLTVDGSPAYVVLITPGPAPAGVTRPSLASSAPYLRVPDPPPACLVGPALSTSEARTYWQQYLSPSDPLNYDHSDNTYATPSSTAYARNRLYVIRP